MENKIKPGQYSDDFTAEALQKKTKILCTIGPASNNPETLREMVRHGMNGCRINTSHGDFEQYREMVERIRSVANIPIVMDTQGPKIRLRMATDINVDEGDTIQVGFTPQDEFFLDAPMYEHLNIGDRALIDDGGFEATIVDKDETHIRLRFNNGGFLVSGRAVNFPKKELPLDPLTEKDVKSLAFARENEVDFIALSFTRGKSDLEECRKHLEGSSVKIIAKIENQQGVDHIDEIIDHADGVMIARGDMGVELEPEEIPMIQKRLIIKLNDAGKLVITATQMLQSMVKSPRPTRAEISDVANAILDGSDVIMLSGETATGAYPVRAVDMMSRVSAHSEQFVELHPVPPTGGEVERAICDSIQTLSERAGVDKIVSVTRRGYTAKTISRLRLTPHIFALTSKIEAFRELHLYYGVIPVWYPKLEYSIRTISAGMYLFDNGWIGENDLVLYASAEYRPKDRRTNTIQLLRMSDLSQYYERFELKKKPGKTVTSQDDDQPSAALPESAEPVQS